MKVRELLELQLTPKAVKRAPQKPSGLPIGAGIQAMVFQHAKAAGMVVKYADVDDPADDGYVKFVEMVLDHQNNPFFPKIKSSKLYAVPPTEYNDESSYMLIVVMEKLRRLSDEDLRHYVPEIFDELGISKELIDFDDPKSIKMLNHMENPRNREILMKNTTNKQFGQALRLLEPLLYRYQQDIRLGNMMFRLTSGKPQLVIIDPLRTLKTTI